MSKSLQGSRNFYIRTISAVIFMLVGLLIFSLLLLRLFQAQTSLREAAENRYQSFLLADRLRHSSDELTRMARTYVATGNPAFKNQFREVLAIRDGEAPRPMHYERIYWDFFSVSNATAPYACGPKIALTNLIQKIGITAEEFAMLEESRANSDALTKLEDAAFSAAEGLFQDTHGDYSIQGKPDREMALSTLFGSEYHKAKISIMYPINCFLTSIDTRTRQEVEKRSAAVRAYTYAISMTFFAVIALAVYSILTVRKSHLEQLIQQRTLKLQIAKDAADIANHTKASFLAHISHEIRTPMNAVMGYAQVLKEGSTNTKLYLEKIITHGRMLITLIDDLIDICDLEAGKHTSAYSTVSPRQLLNDIELLFAEPAGSKGIRLRIDCDPSIPEEIQADQARMRHVLFNLTGNAVKFTDSGEIRLGLRRDSSDLLFTVTDTGSGINPELKDRMFDAFEKDEQLMGRHPGLGLGLTIAKRLVEIMGGEIKVDSQEGVGSTFTVILKGAAAQEPGDTLYPERKHGG